MTLFEQLMFLTGVFVWTLIAFILLLILCGVVKFKTWFERD